MSLAIVPTNEDLNEIVGQVWASYLDPEGVSPLVPGPTEGTAKDIVAAVSISGSWHGHVVVACSEGAARHAAAAFLMMDAAEVSQDDAADVMGELANIVGGNVKSMLPAVCYISLPQVVAAAESAIRWPAAEQVCELAGRWMDEPISISMWQSKSDRQVVQ